jgi:hypothetical protein
MLKYFSSVVEKPINTGGRKLIYDMQETIRNFLVDKKVRYKEYSFARLSNFLHLLLPSPYSAYLVFGYLGSPFLAPPFVVAYSFAFCSIAIKKRIAKEKFYLLVVDLIEWQSALWSTKKSGFDRLFRIFQCFLERFLISHVADEVISIVDNDFMEKNYKINKIHNLEFLEYHVEFESHSAPKPKGSRVLYVGDLGSRRGFDLGFFEEILENLDDSCELWLIASGLEDSMKNRLRRYQNFRFLDQMDANKLDSVARECEFGLILYSPTYLYYNIAPPIKLSFYIANGLTVISTDLKRTRELNEKYGFGFALSQREILELVRGLSSKQTKKNETLREQITKGRFLYTILAKLDLA